MDNYTDSLITWIQNHINNTILHSKPLKGGVSSLVSEHVIAFRSSVVTRQIVNSDWLKEEPDLIAHERDSLVLFANRDLPVPTVIAADVTGFDSRHPTLLMSKLPGRVNLQDSFYQERIPELLRVLHEIHATIIPTTFKWTYAPYVPVDQIKIPTWATNLTDWEKTINFVKNSSPSYEPVFIHRDFHPTNILWEGRNISGVVDWINACKGPALVDVAHCRINFVLLFGIEVAQSFLLAYLKENQQSYTPYWDLVSVFDFIDEEMNVYKGWTDLGHRNLTSDLLKKRTNEYIHLLSSQIYA